MAKSLLLPPGARQAPPPTDPLQPDPLQEVQASLAMLHAKVNQLTTLILNTTQCGGCGRAPDNPVRCPDCLAAIQAANKKAGGRN